MNLNSLQKLVGDTDIYLLDQIMKGRYIVGDTILDAGCGNGRNLHWFLQNDLNVYGIDTDEGSISNLKNSYPHLPADKFMISPVEETIFTDDHFDHIISSAVLHFANSTDQFNKMMVEIRNLLWFINISL